MYSSRVYKKDRGNQMSDKEKIKELEDKIEKLENEVASIRDYIDMKEEYLENFPSASETVN